jgi:predicted HicB family RNase H-like nuclease
MKDAERYAITLRRVEIDGETLWRATVRELPDVAEFAETRERAFELALETIEGLKQAATEEGNSFPEPIEDDEEYSGRVTVRLPISLHRAVAQQAIDEGVSLNSYISLALTVSLAEYARRMFSPPIHAASAPVLAAAGWTMMFQKLGGHETLAAAETTTIVPMHSMIESVMQGESSTQNVVRSVREKRTRQ